jgi:hypothetical protein
MKKIFIASIFTVLSLVGCGSQVQEQAGVRSAASSADFVQAKDGTLYSISCLQGEGSKIAAGVAGAGATCASDKLDKDQVRGIRGSAKSKTYYYYINPVNYYGGSPQQSSNFCGQYFGYTWNGCFNWLGYNNTYYNTPSYQPSCSTCTNVNVNVNVNYGNYPYNYYAPASTAQNSCPSSCTQSQPWTAQPQYNQWNNWNWWYSW